MNMNCALFMHKMPEREDKQSNVSAFASFVNVSSANAIVIVDVMRNEKGSLEDVKDIVWVCG